MGGLYRISEWIMRLSAINLLWVFGSIPFLFLVLSMLLSPSEVDLAVFQQWIFLLAIVAPFTLVPASGAMFTVARKWVTGDEDVPLFKTFWRGYKENYKQSMLGGFVFVLLFVIVFVNYRFYGTQSGTLSLVSYLFIAFFFLLIAAFVNYLSIMVHFHMKFWQIVKNSLLVTIGNPINSVFILIANAVIVYISTKYTFLIPFFMGSLCAVVSYWTFHRSYLRLQMKIEKMNQNQNEENEDGDGEVFETEKELAGGDTKRDLPVLEKSDKSKLE